MANLEEKENQEIQESTVEIKEEKDTLDDFKKLIREAVAQELKIATNDINGKISEVVKEELKKKVVITKKKENTEDKNLKFVEETFSRIKNKLFK